MPEFVEIKDEIYSVDSIECICADVFGEDQYIIRIYTKTKRECVIYFENEELCKSSYLKVRDILLKNTQKLNS